MSGAPAGDLLGVDEALEIILARVPVLAPVELPLPECLGLVLAEEVRAEEDLPPFANSAVDGYAVRSADTAGAGEDAPVALEVVGDSFAGRVPTAAVGPGHAVRTMTGAMLPEGADGMVMVEHTTRDGSRVLIRSGVPAGQHVRAAGENVRRGEVVLAPGREVTPAALGMAATVGRPRLLCHPRPRVAIVSTGDELVEPGLPLGPGQIRNSNSYALEAQVRTAGAVPLRMPVLPDDEGALREGLRRALQEADLVVSSAGVSVGEHDFVKAVMEDLGGRMVFWRVRMRPGKPLAFGVADGVPMIGLPGNPVSSMVGFEVFVRPALRRMAGHPAPAVRRTVRARLAETVEKVPHLRFFNRCRLRPDGAGWVAESTGPQGSGILMSMLHADGLAVLPEGTDRVEAGSVIEVLPLSG